MRKKILILGCFILIFTIAFTIIRNSFSIQEEEPVVEELQISLSSLSEIEEVETGKSLSNPQIVNNSLEGISFSFTNPGDYISFDFSIDNLSNVEGKIANITTKGITCSGEYTEEELADICNNISIDLSYSNSSKEVKEGDIIFANSITPLNATIIYNNGPNTKENVDVHIDNIILEFKFTNTTY